MALIKCKDCDKEISTTANACPNCGAKPRKKKTVLWIVLSIPLLLIFAITIYSLLTPQYKKDALEKRRICEKIAPPHLHFECDRIYQNEIAFGSGVTDKCKSLLDQKKRAISLGNEDGAGIYEKEYRECIQNKK